MGRRFIRRKRSQTSTQSPGEESGGGGRKPKVSEENTPKPGKNTEKRRQDFGKNDEPILANDGIAFASMKKYRLRCRYMVNLNTAFSGGNVGTDGPPTRDRRKQRRITILQLGSVLCFWLLWLFGRVCLLFSVLGSYWWEPALERFGLHGETQNGFISIWCFCRVLSS